MNCILSVQIGADEACFLEIVIIVPDDVIDIGCNDFRKEQITHGVHMPQQEKPFPEFFVKRGTVRIQINDVRIIEFFRKAVQQVFVLVGARFPLRERNQKELCAGAAFFSGV